jgi:hypothetical protein
MIKKPVKKVAKKVVKKPVKRAVKKELIKDLTVKDYFAAKAMQAILDKTLSLHEGNYNQYAAAQIAYQFADAMLHIRAGKPLENVVRAPDENTIVFSSGLTNVEIL